MSSIYSLRHLQKIFLIDQPDPLIIPNAAGVATLAGSNVCLFEKFSLKQNIQTIQRPDNSGTLSTLPGQKGRMGGSWSGSLSMAGSGTAATPPDCGPILDAIFGQAGVAGSGHVIYNLADACPTFAAYHFRKPASLTQYIGGGCAVKEASFVMGSDVAMMSASGDCIFVLDSDNFGNYIAQAKMGLTAFPIEPTTPTPHGNFAIGFMGVLTIDGQTSINLKSLTIKIASNKEIVKDTFNSLIGSGVESDTRVIGVDFVLDDTDSSDPAAVALKTNQYDKQPFAISAQVGLTDGNKWKFDLAGVQLDDMSLEDNQRRFRTHWTGTAHGTTPYALDNVVATLS